MSVFLYKNIFWLGNEDTKFLPNKEQNYTAVQKNVNKEYLMTDFFKCFYTDID